MPYVLESEKVTPDNIHLLGGKSAHLAELLKAGFPVPKAYFITVDAYNKFLDENRIRESLNLILLKVNYSDQDSLRTASDHIKELFLSRPIPQKVKEDILGPYKLMSYSREMAAAIIMDLTRASMSQMPFIAVRSSAITEDLEGASAAGAQETFLNVKGQDELIESVKKCWASLFTPRAMYYRHKNSQEPNPGIGVAIQIMVNSERSGVVFTADPMKPATGNNRIVIEASWGVGETVVQGMVNPDVYVVDKNNGDILERKIGSKEIERVRDLRTGRTVEKQVPEYKKKMQVLKDIEIVNLAAICNRIEKYYGHPQDIEWCTEHERMYIVQTRAITTLEKVNHDVHITGTPILEGYGASPGVATGRVRIIRNLNEIGKIEKGDILVTEMTSPDFVPAMERSTAIITNLGGATCHAAIVSRELGIPCIVGTNNATRVLKDGQEITVDAQAGKVYEGKIHVEPTVLETVPRETSTKISIKANIAFPQTAAHGRHADGVGLVRLEHMLTKGGKHPAQYIRDGNPDELTNIIVEGVGTIAKIFTGKPVWVRSADIRTDEFRNLTGGDNEPKEDNPMLGWHGVRRDLDEPALLTAQLKAFKRLHEDGLTNVQLMIPFVINAEEVRKVKEAAASMGMPGTLKFGVMVETPAAALSIDELCREGIEFISFGSNDLTQLTLGLDRNNQRLNKLFDEMHPSMRYMFKHVIDTCKKYGVETSICGEAPSNRRDIVEFLFNSGIDSLSVNIDAIDKVRTWVAELEKG